MVTHIHTVPTCRHTHTKHTLALSRRAHILSWSPVPAHMRRDTHSPLHALHLNSNFDRVAPNPLAEDCYIHKAKYTQRQAPHSHTMGVRQHHSVAWTAHPLLAKHLRNTRCYWSKSTCSHGTPTLGERPGVNPPTGSAHPHIHICLLSVTH